MFALKRNQVVITALLMMIGVAGYLTYVDGTGADINPIALNEQGEVSALITDVKPEGVPVNGTVGVLTINENPSIAVEGSVGATTDDSKVGEAVFVNSSADSTYFVQAKLDREQARAKQKDILMEMINNDNVDTSQKTEITNEILQIQERIEKETAAEAMIESKGFKNVYVRIDDDTVDVVVSKAELSDSEIAQIEDIVKRKTGVESEKIRISAAK